MCSRRVLNQEDILHRLEQRGLTHVVVTTISGSNSTAQQSCSFATAGLIIAPHSSQLANMAFALPSAAIVRAADGVTETQGHQPANKHSQTIWRCFIQLELTVGIQPLDFAESAEKLGIHYQVLFTGTTANSTGPPPEVGKKDDVAASD